MLGVAVVLAAGQDSGSIALRREARAARPWAAGRQRHFAVQLRPDGEIERQRDTQDASGNQDAFDQQLAWSMPDDIFIACEFCMKCAAIPDNHMGASDAECGACTQNRQRFPVYPCHTPGLCKCLEPLRMVASGNGRATTTSTTATGSTTAAATTQATEWTPITTTMMSQVNVAVATTTTVTMQANATAESGSMQSSTTSQATGTSLSQAGTTASHSIVSSSSTTAISTGTASLASRSETSSMDANAATTVTTTRLDNATTLATQVSTTSVATVSTTSAVASSMTSVATSMPLTSAGTNTTGTNVTNLQSELVRDETTLQRLAEQQEREMIKLAEQLGQSGNLSNTTAASPSSTTQSLGVAVSSTTLATSNAEVLPPIV